MNTRNTQFTVPTVRHLTWCLLSPPLAAMDSIQSLNISNDEALFTWLDQLNKNPSHLLKYIQENNHRLLGSYFECLWQYYFLHGPNAHLLDHHVQVSDGKQTLGEMDILAILHDQSYHIELAVKFYLQLPNTSGKQPAHWVGPQSHDRLDIKLEKLQQKQFPFLYHPCTTHLLAEKNLDKDYTQALALKGYLFREYTADYEQTKKNSEQLPEACEHGSKGKLSHSPNLANWIHAKNLQQVLDKQEAHWAILEKHQWLGEYFAQSDEQVSASSQVQTTIHQHFYENKQPQKIFALMLVKMEKVNGGYLESERYFVVHDHWPAHPE